MPPSIHVTFVRELLGKLPAIGETCSCAMKLRSVHEAVRAGMPPRPSPGALTDFLLHLGDSRSVQATGELSMYSHLTDTFQIISVLIPSQFYTIKEQKSIAIAGAVLCDRQGADQARPFSTDFRLPASFLKALLKI